MDRIVSHESHSSESLNFEALTKCISAIHSALQSSAVNAINRFATIRNWLIGRYIVEYEQCGNDRAQYGANLLSKLAGKLKAPGINTTLLKNARRFYLAYPQLSEVAYQICPMLSDKSPELAPILADYQNKIELVPISFNCFNQIKKHKSGLWMF